MVQSGNPGKLDGLDVNGKAITSVLDPVNPQDAATKNYVDTHGGGGVAAPTNLFNTSYENKQFTGHAFTQNAAVPTMLGTKSWNGNAIEPSTGIFFACDDTPWGPAGAGMLMEVTPAGVITEHDVGTLYSMQAECIAWSAVANAFYLVGYDISTGNTYIYKITGPTGARVFTLQITGVAWHGVAISINQATGDIWVSDYSSANVHLFRAGSPITEDLSSPIALGSGTGAFDVCVDGIGDCWVAGQQNSMIFRIDLATLAVLTCLPPPALGTCIVFPGSLPLTTVPPTRFCYDIVNGWMYFTGKQVTSAICAQFKPADYAATPGGGPPTNIKALYVSFATTIFPASYIGGLDIHPVTGSLYFTNALGITNGNILAMRVMTPFNISSSFVNNYQLPFTAPWGDEYWRASNTTIIQKCIFSNVGGVVRLWWADTDATIFTGTRVMGNFLNCSNLWETLITPGLGKKIRVRNCNIQSSQITTNSYIYLKFVTSGIDITQYGTNKISGPDMEGQYVEGAINEAVSIQSTYYNIMASIQLAYDEV